MALDKRGRRERSGDDSSAASGAGGGPQGGPPRALTMTSMQVFRRYLRETIASNGEVLIDASLINSADCYHEWLSSRPAGSTLEQAHKVFQRTLTAHVSGSDGRVPFSTHAERAILEVLRVKKVWPCFANNPSITIGQHGFRTLGWHEKKRITGGQLSPPAAAFDPAPKRLSAVVVDGKGSPTTNRGPPPPPSPPLTSAVDDAIEIHSIEALFDEVIATESNVELMNQAQTAMADFERDHPDFAALVCFLDALALDEFVLIQNNASVLYLGKISVGNSGNFRLVMTPHDAALLFRQILQLTRQRLWGIETGHFSTIMLLDGSHKSVELRLRLEALGVLAVIGWKS